jgi:hypothetical protein
MYMQIVHTNARAFSHPVVKARRADGKLAFVGYADRAAHRFKLNINGMLDALLQHGVCRASGYFLTFADAV